MKKSKKESIKIVFFLLTTIIFLTGSMVFSGINKSTMVEKDDKSKKPVMSPKQLIENFKKKEFTGESYDFKFQDARLDMIMKFFSHVTGLNFVFNPGVEGTVTYTLNKIPWDKALYLFLEQNGLELVLKENTLMIQKKEKTEKESKYKKEDKK